MYNAVLLEISKSPIAGTGLCINLGHSERIWTTRASLLNEDSGATTGIVLYAYCPFLHVFFSIVDYINIMTYDYHGIWSESTGANAPLYPQLTDSEDSLLNVVSFFYVDNKNWLKYSYTQRYTLRCHSQYIKTLIWKKSKPESSGN